LLLQGISRTQKSDLQTVVLNFNRLTTNFDVPATRGKKTDKLSWNRNNCLALLSRNTFKPIIVVTAPKNS
jgi:hypothetical protein